MNTNLSAESMIPQAQFVQLLRALREFCSGDHLSLAHVDIELAVEQRYMKGAAGSELEIALHKLLAAYYMKAADPSWDGSFSGNTSRAFMQLPYHLVSHLNVWVI